jgi:hypothetical protein
VVVNCPKLDHLTVNRVASRVTQRQGRPWFHHPPRGLEATVTTTTSPVAPLEGDDALAAITGDESPNGQPITGGNAEPKVELRKRPDGTVRVRTATKAERKPHVPIKVGRAKKPVEVPKPAKCKPAKPGATKRAATAKAKPKKPSTKKPTSRKAYPEWMKGAVKRSRVLAGGRIDRKTGKACGPDTLSYPGPRQHLAIRTRVSEMLKEKALDVTADNILALTGVKSHATLKKIATWTAPKEAMKPMRPLSAEFSDDSWAIGRYLAAALVAWCEELKAAK